MRKYHIKKTMKSKRPNDVVQTMTDTGTRQFAKIAIVPGAKYKKADIFAVRDAIIADATLAAGGDKAAKIRIKANLDIAFDQFFVNAGYYEEVANELDLPDLYAELGYESNNPHTPGTKLAIEIRNTNISGKVLAILLGVKGAKYYIIQAMVSNTEPLLDVKTMHKTRAEISGFTPGLKYMFRACACDSNDNIISITDYFELRIT